MSLLVIALTWPLLAQQEKNAGLKLEIMTLFRAKLFNFKKMYIYCSEIVEGD